MTELAYQDAWRRVYDDVARLLLDRHLEPTPANYAMAHRHVTAGAACASEQAANGRGVGGLFAASAAAFTAERSVELSAADLHGMVAEAEARLSEVHDLVGRSHKDTREYGRALASNAADLEAGAPVQPVVDALIALTRSMISRTSCVEEQLHAASDEIRQLRESLTEAQDQANRDALTGLPNRRALDAQLAIASEAARTSGRPFSIAICDIDHFKAFNDRFGHQIGDEVIKLVAASLARDAGERLFAARYGGEEFVVLFEGLDAAAAGREVDRIRAMIGARSLRVNATGQTLGRLTFSAGIAQHDADDESVSAMLKRADVALYEAKRAGRDRVIVG
jgi:diguanylate cyclase